MFRNVEFSVGSNDSSKDSSTLASPTAPTATTTRAPSMQSLSALTSSMSIPGQTSSVNLTELNDLLTHRLHEGYDVKMGLIIVCVGLPARGKSYITKKLQRYLNWMQYETKIFNVGNVRRQNDEKPSNIPLEGNGAQHDSKFFDHENKENFRRREEWAKETLDQLLDYIMNGSGSVGIFDATNSTKARRKWIVETINQRTQGAIKVLFLESICTDSFIIEKNIRLKLSGPDYKHIDRNEALRDFRNRLANYEKVYETIDDEEEEENEKYDISYVKIVNAGKKVVSYNIQGYLASQAVFFLLNFNLAERQIWLAPSGESTNNVKGRLGGDSSLSDYGMKFSKALPKFVSKKRLEFKLHQLSKRYVNSDAVNDLTTFSKHNQIDPPFNIWTSMMKRSIQTASFFPKSQYQVKNFRMLNDIGCGSLDGINHTDFSKEHNSEYESRLKNKLSYRYPGPGGESYLDVINRLKPIIIELERLKDHVLITSHTVITRVLLGYFINLSEEMMTDLEIGHGHVYCIEPKPYGLDLKVWAFDEQSEDFYEVDEVDLTSRKPQHNPHEKRRSSIATGMINLQSFSKENLGSDLKEKLNHKNNSNATFSFGDGSDMVYNYSSDDSSDESVAEYRPQPFQPEALFSKNPSQSSSAFASRTVSPVSSKVDDEFRLHG